MGYQGTEKPLGIKAKSFSLNMSKGKHEIQIQLKTAFQTCATWQNMQECLQIGVHIVLFLWHILYLTCILCIVY